MRKLIWKKWLFSILALAIWDIPGWAAEPPQRLLMAALGDSITAATLADIPFPHSADDESVRGLTPEDLRRRSIEPKFIYENKTYLSWASGVSIPSHYVMLRSNLKAHGEKRPLDILNVATPGNTTHQLESQAKEVHNAMASGKYAALKYVTILMGSNDACSQDSPIGTPLEKMKENLMAAFSILSTIPQGEPIHILVAGIPRIPNLGTPAYRKASTILGLSCETLRNKLFHLCDPLILWGTPEEYQQKMRVVQDKNRLLRDFVREAMKVFPNLDIVYSNRLYQLEIPIDVLAADCFHPSLAGQIAISLEIWHDQPWFN